MAKSNILSQIISNSLFIIAGIVLFIFRKFEGLCSPTTTFIELFIVLVYLVYLLLKLIHAFAKVFFPTEDDNAEEEDGPTLIQKNSIIRFRVLNVNLDSANCIEVFSTMSDDYLGVLEDPSEFD